MANTTTPGQAGTIDGSDRTHGTLTPDWMPAAKRADHELQGSSESSGWHTRDTTYTGISRSNSLSTPPKRFRDTVHMIEPTNPRPPKRYDPLIMRLAIVVLSPLMMFLMGIALEVAAALSKAQSGFAISGRGIRTVFGDVSAQFLASVLPTIIILPNAILWRELDWMLRSYQPFIALHKGGASAEESILLDYVELGPLLTVPRALKYKHRIVLVSSLTAVLTYFFQPLTGAVLQIRQTPQIQPFTALRTETLGLSPDASNLQGFLAASGYTDASFLHNFTDDPQFVKNAWATGKFTYSLQPLLNATLKVTTHGVRVTANCSNPIEDPRMERSGTFISFNSTSVNNCEQRVVFSTSSGADNYHGVTAVGSCAPDDPSLDVSLQTIMFWFYRRGSGTSDEEVKTVFCRPFLTGTEARVYASISTGRILALETVVETAPFNDVLNGDFAGKAFNGVVFEPNEDPYVEARATAIRMQVPSTILQRMIQRDESVELAFSKPNGVLDATTAVYTRHLAVSAKSVYFVAGDSDLRGELTSIEPRLWVDPFPAHFLAAALMLTGFAGMFLHVKNRSQRKQVHLATQPGSIAATVSLTSRSGWGELLTPYDDIVALEKKMEGMKFTLDKRTGAIVAEEAAGPPAGPVLPLRLSEEFDIQMSLMGKYEPSPGVETMESSSFAAFQTAAGITPWRGKGKS